MMDIFDALGCALAVYMIFHIGSTNLSEDQKSVQYALAYGLLFLLAVRFIVERRQVYTGL